MTGIRKSRDYKSEYQRRKEALAKRGLTPASEARLRRERGTSIIGPATLKQQMLARFGVTERQFEGMRIANLEHTQIDSRLERYSAKSKQARKALGEAISVNWYDASRDIPNDWSEERVGYVTSFYRAIVDPNTNYSSLLDKDGQRIVYKNGKYKTNKYQAQYMGKYRNARRAQNGQLVQYTGNLSISEFETRYGAILE